MRVGIEAQSLFNVRTGVQQYLYHLLEGLARVGTNDLFSAVYFSARRRNTVLPFAGDMVVERRLSFPPGRALSFLWKHLPSPAFDMFARGMDVYHFPNFVVRPIGRRKKIVLTIHDLAFERLPNSVEEKNLKYLKKFVGPSVDRADRIITDSKFTKEELINFYPSAEGKTEVIYLGVGDEFAREYGREMREEVRRKYGLPKKYILSVGTMEPRKNLAGLLIAYRMLRERGTDISLALCGARGWKCDDLVGKIVGGELGRRVIWTGYVDQADLPLIYQGARCFVFPSLYEGFGLPPLEAMAAGVPVVCSEKASLPDVVGTAAVMVQPEKPESIANGIEKILSDPNLSQELVSKGRARVDEFTWDETARCTLDIYRSL